MMQGDPGDTAVLPTNNFTTTGFTSTIYSGVKLDSDGMIYERQATGNTWSSFGAWLLNGTNSDFFIKRTIDSGILDTDAGTPHLVLSSDREYDVQRSTNGEDTATVTFTIVDSGDTVVYANRTYIFTAIRGAL